MEEKVLKILVELCGTDEVRENKDINLFETGLLSSLAVIELILEIKSKIGILVQPTEVNREDIDTPNKIINYLISRENYS